MMAKAQIGLAMADGRILSARADAGGTELHRKLTLHHRTLAAAADLVHLGHLVTVGAPRRECTAVPVDPVVCADMAAFVGRRRPDETHVHLWRDGGWTHMAIGAIAIDDMHWDEDPLP